MNKNISDIYNLIQELSWYFGNQGFNGKCCGDLSLVEFLALKKTYDNGNYSIQEIANALNFTKSGATRIVNRLESKGYVTRERSSTDGRVCCITVNDKGIEVITKITEKYTAYVEKILEDLESKIIANVKKVLEILVNSAHKKGFIEKS